MSKYPVMSYVPKKVDCVYDLDTRLNYETTEEILNDLDGHFKRCYITNFDLIHHNCRGDKLNFSKRFYQTVDSKKLRENLNLEQQINFVEAGIKSERDDLYFEKKIYKDHFERIKRFEEKGIFLSNMRKKFYFKKTEDCKLKF